MTRNPVPAPSPSSGAVPASGRRDAAPAADGIALRRASWALLAAVLDRRQPLSGLDAALPPSVAALDRAGQATALRMARTTLRHLERAERIVAPLLQRKPPPQVMHALLTATVELLHERASAHGVVHSTVAGLRGAARTRSFAGLANAVLRRIAVLPVAQWEALPPQRLPGWMRARLVEADGAGVVRAMEAAHLCPPPRDLTLRQGADAEHWASALGARRLPTGSLRLDARRAVSELPGFGDGAWWVQDAAAALPARLLGAALDDAGPAGAGERVLDICAAPGGKTLQLAAMGAQVTALDISAARLERVTENLQRTRLQARIVHADARYWRPEAPFSQILLDAPCTASGTIRRHPEVPFLRRAADLKALVALQAELLDRVLDPAQGLLAPGGRVVYCVCSLLAAEGEDQIGAALKRHGNVVPVPEAAAAVPGIDADWRTPLGGLRTRPDHWAADGSLDGFYMIALQHQGPDTTGQS